MRRWLNLLKSDSVSKQETDDRVAAAKAAAATLDPHRRIVIACLI